MDHEDEGDEPRDLDAQLDEMTRLGTDAECNDAADRMVGFGWDY
jgi:hypothetical protein